MEGQTGAQKSAGTSERKAKATSFLDLLRVPDSVTVYSRLEETSQAGKVRLQRSGERWSGGQAEVEAKAGRDSLVLTVAAPSAPIAVVHVRWRVDVAPGLLALGDAWERSYGELGWRNVVPERIMPWYFATWDGTECHGYGVKTDARAMCFWQLDPEGVSLWLNVSNGGDGVELGQRQLTMATVVNRRGVEDENAQDSIAGLCRRMCGRASRPAKSIYGANDWDNTYGHSTAESILRDTDFIAELSPSGGVRPFSVVDEGYFPGTPEWPSMNKLADEIRQRTVRPGIWIRPLRVPKGTAQGLLMPDARFGERKERALELAFDPTIPEAKEKIRGRVLEATGWGFEMIKHDFSTYDLLGQWGFEMGPRPTLPGWSFNDRTRTNAEVIADLYTLIRKTAGEAMLLDGCNTVGHLGQGVFDVQRTGDDTSGRQWERTRRMGVNTLAFRLPQNANFFTLDADMAGITEEVPWELNRQWLDVLARSGTTTIISAGSRAKGPDQRAAIREAFQIAASGGMGAKPVDWMETSTPEHWRGRGEGERRYRWSDMDGASPLMNP
jgi:alpha-galactosidase